MVQAHKILFENVTGIICGCRITVYYTRLPSQGRGFDSHQPLALVMEFGNAGIIPRFSTLNLKTVFNAGTVLYLRI